VIRQDKINDRKLSEFISEINRAQSRLNHLHREWKEKDLFLELLRIHRASEEAMWRLNDLDLKTRKEAP